MKGYKVVGLILVVLLVDQILKFWIKTNMSLGEQFSVIGTWFNIHFTENEGMAFGLSFGGSYGKLFLSIFRLIAVGFIGYYLVTLIKTNAPKGLVYCMALILAGAIGNIIDSVFYGVIFSASTYHQVAEFMPEGGGYAPLLYGKVVDMFYLPLWEGYLPDWIPFMGGDYFVFFQPVFNIADAAISIGVLTIIFFQRSFFKEDKSEKELDKKLEKEPVRDII